MIDVSLPVPEFREKIKDMAHTYPFELDTFQKQVYFFFNLFGGLVFFMDICYGLSIKYKLETLFLFCS